jgi:gas vesicle protein
VAKTPTQQIGELRTDFAILRERVETLSRDQHELNSERKTHGNELKELQRQVALLTQRFDDHLKQVEKWDQRRWMLYGLLIGAILSFAANLVVALVRK